MPDDWPVTEDHCYPGVTLHYSGSKALESYEWRSAVLSPPSRRATTSTRITRGASPRAAATPTARRAPGTFSFDGPHTECNVTELGIGSYVLRTRDHSTLMCNQGPWMHQLAFLATLKSSPMLYFPQSDSLEPHGCAYRGCTRLPEGSRRRLLEPCAVRRRAHARPLLPPSTLWARENQRHEPPTSYPCSASRRRCG